MSIVAKFALVSQSAIANAPLDGTLGSFPPTNIINVSSGDSFINWLAAVATIVPVVVSLLATHSREQGRSGRAFVGNFFSVARLSSGPPRIEGKVSLCEVADDNDDELKYRALRQLAIASFAVGFLLFLCMIDMPRYSLAQWVDLIVTPGGA